MFLIKLANQLGWVDPDELADRMTPEQMDERIAHYRLDPWGDEWQIGAMVAASVANSAINQISARAGKMPRPDEMVDPAMLVPRPGWVREADEDTRRLSDDEAERQLRGMV